MSLPAVALHHFTREEYQRIGAAGLFPARVELIEGAVYDRSPQKSAQAVVVSLAEAALRAAFGAGFYIRVQMPLALGGRRTAPSAPGSAATSTPAGTPAPRWSTASPGRSPVPPRSGAPRRAGLRS